MKFVHIAVAVLLAAAPIAIQGAIHTNWVVVVGTDTGYPSATLDLINTGSAALESEQHDDYESYTGATGTSSPTNLNDGTTGGDNIVGDIALDLSNGWTSTYILDTTTARAGYHVTKIQTICGWTAPLGDQRYEVFYSTASAPDSFISIGSFACSTNVPSDQYTTRITITDDDDDGDADYEDGIVASNTKKIRFVFDNIPGYDYTACYREMDVFGDPAPTGTMIVVR